jgi:hypothetical protein
MHSRRTTDERLGAELAQSVTGILPSGSPGLGGPS